MAETVLAQQEVLGPYVRETATQFTTLTMTESDSTNKNIITMSSGRTLLIVQNTDAANTEWVTVEASDDAYGRATPITQQAIPGPGEVDNTDYESITRASYAEPLQIDGYFNLRVHFDNSNGARNNRFSAGMNLDALGNL